MRSNQTGKYLFRYRRLGLLLVLNILLFGNNLLSQQAVAQIIQVSEKKEAYFVGNEINYLITVKIPPEICPDGMDKTKIYLSGYTQVKKSNWNQLSPGHWEKKVYLKIIENKKGICKITVVRRADKGDFFLQDKIVIKE